MPRARFPLHSDQLELLLAFEVKGSLVHLADEMAKDQSVISRNLQKLAETLPVIEKIGGRWQITEMGRSLNKLTRGYIDQITEATKSITIQSKNIEACFSKNAVLLVINAQKALEDSTTRSNFNAEKNIELVLNKFRSENRSVVHVKHVSKNAQSNFFETALGAQFIEQLVPNDNEYVFEKSKSSSFVDTNLYALLTEIQADALVLVGFTANDCIDSTARSASDLGFTTYVVGDATATFDVLSEGKLFKADRIHKLTLATIDALYAKVISTDYIIQK